MSTARLCEAYDSVVASPLFGLTLTLVAYLLARAAWRRSGRLPVANPVLLAVAAIGAVISLLHVSYSDYLNGAGLIALLLGPATVSLALPLHRELPLIRRAAVPVIAGVLCGCVTSIAAAYLVTRSLGGNDEVASSMAPKSATTAVSIALSADNGGVASLTAVFTILAGILGAVAGPWLLRIARIRDERAVGLAIGVASHGIGTARLFSTGPRQAATFSGLAMALNTLTTSIAVPLLLPVLR